MLTFSSNLSISGTRSPLVLGKPLSEDFRAHLEWMDFVVKEYSRELMSALDIGRVQGAANGHGVVGWDAGVLSKYIPRPTQHM